MTNEETCIELAAESYSQCWKLNPDEPPVTLTGYDTDRLIDHVDIVKANEPFDTREFIEILDKDSERIKFMTISNPNYRMPKVLRSFKRTKRSRGWKIKSGELMLFYDADGGLLWHCVVRIGGDGKLHAFYNSLPRKIDGKVVLLDNPEWYINQYTKQHTYTL